MSRTLRAFLLVGVVAMATGAGVVIDRSRSEDPGPLKTLASRPGIWFSAEEARARSTLGRGWQQLKAAADGPLGTPNIRDQDSDHDVRTLAVALVYARTGAQSYRDKASRAVMSAVGTESGGSSLALARNLVSYVISADLVGLSTADASSFRAWLKEVVGRTMSDGKSLKQTHELRPNNWGTHAGASRAAAAVYLGDGTELARTARVFKGWLGDRASWSGFKYGDLSWQCRSDAPVGVNPARCFKNGYSVDGVLPDDQRRSGPPTQPPPKENYVYEALQGAVVQAEILYRAGYPAWDWQSRALLRAFSWLHDRASYPADGDDQWQPWLVNRRYGTRFPAADPARYGKNMGWTDWTHR